MKTVSHIIPKNESTRTSTIFGMNSLYPTGLAKSKQPKVAQDHLTKSKKVVPQPIHFNDYQINNFFRSVCHGSYLECAKQYVKFEQEMQYSVQDREHLRAFLLSRCKRIIKAHDDGRTVEAAVAESNMCFGYLHNVTGDRQLDLIMVAGYIADKLKEL